MTSEPPGDRANDDAVAWTQLVRRDPVTAIVLTPVAVRVVTHELKGAEVMASISDCR